MKNQSTVEELDRYIDKQEGEVAALVNGETARGVVKRNKYGYWLDVGGGDVLEMYIGGLDLRDGGLVYDTAAGRESRYAAEDAGGPQDYTK